MDGEDEDGEGSEDERSSKNIEPTHVRIARGWNDAFYFVAGDDLLKIDQVTRISATQFFNYLAYRKDKDTKERNLRKQQELQNKR